MTTLTETPTETTESGRETDYLLGREWTTDARCRRRDVDSELFHPGDYEGSGGRHVTKVNDAREAAAKAVCAECPVTRECRDYVLLFETATGGTVSGVYGGLGEKERVPLIKAARRERRRRREEG